MSESVPSPALSQIDADALRRLLRQCQNAIERARPAIDFLRRDGGPTSAKLGQLAGRYRAGSIKHNLGRAASILIAQERVISRATDLGMLADMAKIPRELPRYLQAATRPGTFFGDVLRANDQGATDMDRLQAMTRLQESWLRQPLHPVRFRLALPELSSRAEKHETDVAGALSAAVLASLPLAIDQVLSGEGPIRLSELLKAVRSALANLMMDDLIGPGWRRTYTVTVVEFEDKAELPDDLDVAYQAECRMLLSELLRRAPELPAAERAALGALLRDEPMPGATRQALFRLRRSALMKTLREGIPERFSKN